MPLDPQAQALLDTLNNSGAPPLDKLEPPAARELTRQMFRAQNPEPVAQLVNRKIPGPGGDIPIRIYTPAGAGPFPVLVFFHGGGFVICDLDSHDGVCRSLTNRAGCVTVSVDYRLAPEHRFPAAVEDCRAATLWVARHAAELGVDPRRLAVGGDSAGGNLAAVMALMAREAGEPAIAFQLLVYPATDASLNTQSHREFTDYFLTKDLIAYFWRHYVAPGTDQRDPRLSPALARSHRGLPPALVITAEFDPLRDEGEAYAEILRAAGVRARAVRYPGMIHGFFTMGDVLDQGRKAVAEAGQALREALSE